MLEKIEQMEHDVPDLPLRILRQAARHLNLHARVRLVLEYSTAYAIEHLDLDEVRRRQYMNLRISWLRACPNWINTSVAIWSEGFD
jgi:hypothetical protein